MLKENLNITRILTLVETINAELAIEDPTVLELHALSVKDFKIMAFGQEIWNSIHDDRYILNRPLSLNNYIRFRVKTLAQKRFAEADTTLAALSNQLKLDIDS